jgi:N utilization substance protein A
MGQENDIMQAVKQICEEKNISLESVVETIEAALAVAYRKDFGEKNQNIKVEFDLAKAKSRVWDVKTVVTDEKFELTEKLKEEKKAQEEAAAAEGKLIERDSAGEGDAGENEEDKFERFNPKTEITLTEAKKIKKGAKLEDVIKTELFPPAAYGRMAAQTAKQVIIQRLREAERENIYKEYKGKEGEVINGTIQRIEGRMVLVDLGQTIALLPPPEQVPRERYAPGQRLRFYVAGVNTTSKGPEIILSRAHQDMVRKLFSLEVPEIASGSVEIKALAREAGSRTKVAVATTQRNIDPVGSCVGQRGSRVQTIISEIGGEKIDIIEWDANPVKFISNALSPAKVLSVKINEEEKTALAEVKDDQLSLAIGKAGQNVRLSAKLTGWKIDIISDSGEKVSERSPDNAGIKKEEAVKNEEVVEAAPVEPAVETVPAEEKPEKVQEPMVAPTEESPTTPTVEEPAKPEEVKE